MHHEPPTHRADAEGVWIHFLDRAYRKDLVEQQIEQMAADRKAAADRLSSEYASATTDEQKYQLNKSILRLDDIYSSKAHPMFRYYAGETRYDLQAEMRIPRADGQPDIVRAADYFGPDARKFRLRRLPRAVWLEVNDEATSNVATDVKRISPGLSADDLAPIAMGDAVARRRGREKAVLYGLKSADGLDLPRTKDADGRERLDDRALDMLHDLDAGLVDLLARAVLSYSQPLRTDEFLPSA